MQKKIHRRKREGKPKGICACDETRHSKMQKNKKALNDKKKKIMLERQKDHVGWN